ncbi:tRNA (adenosine(37)-N6)-threonylcarbamoyltransferase complex transferase subunit TsaD [Formicincola oecophyllae]|uniref:tRNA N6-adenosine threonylcarbamoyltransferase n=1 Tax=Formicincola oecophyllae TaxID=2558361 RepID=A0A4Y6UC02_9PROT|nr:tRNA (adenosine(37)-N6)-threonylcarbamoyltransferase complex transferase subunit TsaD [Formicincola oecophyllae]QDH13921.1 tRNA (adenosine(37)-N6)-threonylcarbamoyltransferase complex transferase subunit TsaD [Formicincola oecophyllae]
MTTTPTEPSPSPSTLRVLAIESSCDDTGCAILDGNGTILAEGLHTQQSHAALGGVVPEIAARAHLAILPGLVAQTLADAGLGLRDVSIFAATTGPGLIGGVVVGSTYAKGMALALGKPFMAINHIEGHVLAPRLAAHLAGDTPPAFPYLALLMSGGHSQCVLVMGVGRYKVLGGTIDDAAGEAFDKAAKMLGLGWPGGPALEVLARQGDPRAHALPRPLLGRAGCDFSFSGLKTAVARLLEPWNGPDGLQALPQAAAADIAASFQQAVGDCLVDRLNHAFAQCAANNIPLTTLVVAGGVAANQNLRARLAGCAERHHVRFEAPPLRHCTDNAAMIGWAALERLRARGWGQRATAALTVVDELTTPARPRWPLEERGPEGP